MLSCSHSLHFFFLLWMGWWGEGVASDRNEDKFLWILIYTPPLVLPHGPPSWSSQPQSYCKWFRCFKPSASSKSWHIRAAADVKWSRDQALAVSRARRKFSDGFWKESPPEGFLQLEGFEDWSPELADKNYNTALSCLILNICTPVRGHHFAHNGLKGRKCRLFRSMFSHFSSSSLRLPLFCPH